MNINGNSLRPLSRPRLEQLVSGLGVRMSSSAQLLDEELNSLEGEIKQLESQHEMEIRHLDQESQSQKDTVTTDCDERTGVCWDDAELRTYRAVFETRNRERNIVATAKTDTEQVHAEAKTRVATIEKRFSHSLEQASQKLEHYRTQLDTVRRVIDKIEMDAEAALAKHSLRVSAPVATLSPIMVRDSLQSLEQAKVAAVAAQQHVKRLENLPMANLFKSGLWWLLCFVAFALGIAIPWFVFQVAPIIAVAIGFGVVCLTALIAMLGVRPWLIKSAAQEFPRVKSHLQLARGYLQTGNDHSIQENDAEQKRLAAKRDERFNNVTSWHESSIAEIKEKAEKTILAMRAKAQEEKQLAASRLSSGLAELDNNYKMQIDQQQVDFQQRRNSVSERLIANRTSLRQQIDQLRSGGAHRQHVATEKAVRFIHRNNQWCSERFPPWESLEPVQSPWPNNLEMPLLPLGQLNINSHLGNTESSSPVFQNLESRVLFSPLDDHYLVLHADPTHPALKESLKSIILRALTTLPPGKTQLCIVDPPGLGRDFGWVMPLSDFDPNLVTHRVWTQPSHIARQLQNLASNAEDFIQQSLRNQYANIIDYNRDAGSLAEPFRILIWSSMPSGMDEQSWKSLQSLLDTGSRCGIIPILIVDPALPWQREQEELVERRGLHLTLNDSGQFVVKSAKIGSISLQPEQPASDSQVENIIREVGRRALASHRVEVPLESIVATSESERWLGDSSRSLEVPIGKSGVGRIHSMKLGVGTAQHAIIAGKTGSGKSSLLHALITSALMRYSPENLRVVLLDFKKGVEFQVYSDAKIPHADIIGIESHREFGLSALEYVDDCLQRRGEMFRKSGVQDIASWNAVHPENTIPRMLVVVDEFQELFVEDDKLSQAASLILDRIVRQGRSFGVHAILSSQTLAGSYSLPRTTLGQMAVRIALQCDPSDAQIIFADDNPAATRLKHPGQAVYNDTGGRIEGNQPMQIGWLDKATQVRWFSQLPQGYSNRDSSTNRLGRTVVYDGNRPATWEPAQAELAIARSKQEINPEAIWCIVGESVSISPAVAFPLTNQAGRNMLIVGGEDAMAAAVIEMTTASFIKDCIQRGKSPQLFAIQGAKPTDARALALPNRWNNLECEKSIFDLRSTDECIKQLHELMQQRVAEGNSTFDPVFVNIIQLGRLRSLRRDEEFSFSPGEATADKMLEEILRDGPSHSIFVLVWAESYSTVNRWLSRTSIREFEVRMLMQMSANDSSNLVDSVAASKLGDHVMLLYDEATGQEQKFRPFSHDSSDAIAAWIGPKISAISDSVPTADGDTAQKGSPGVD
jgi:DNA segregation ATPase FtsK/SpoIIIE, S-DNA-T family